MSTRQSTRDIVKALEAQYPVIGQLASQGESMHAHGVYHVMNEAVKPHLEAEYSEMLEAAATARKLHQWRVLDKLEQNLKAFPKEIAWKADAPNLVVTQGRNHLLDQYLAGSSYTATWFMLLISNASYSAIVAGDTAASHAGWTESVAYSNATRPTAAWSAASGGSKALSAGLVFNINATDTIRGSGMISNSTKGGTTGVLLSAGLFTGGDQPVVNTNTLTVTYTLTV